MSDHHSPIDNQGDEQSGFYKSEESSDKQKNEQYIPSKSDAFKKEKPKRKPIHKRQKPHRKQKTNKQQEKQRRQQQLAEQKAEEIIKQMETRYDEDRALYQKKKPANKKLTYLKTLSQQLKKVIVWDKFLQLGGIQQFQLWFAKLPEGIQPSLTLRKGLLEILDSLKIKSQNISRVASIQRIVQKHKKSQTKELRQLSESILLKWSKTMHEEQIEG